MGPRVFISSTKKDLERYREAVTQALAENGYEPVGMEKFHASDESPVVDCKRQVAESQLFVGIYAWRYGYVPDGAKTSITEQEFQQAFWLGRPRFCFLADESHPWPAAPAATEESAERREQLRVFKASVQEKEVVERFTSPEGLARQVIAALRDHEERQKRARLARPELGRLLGQVEGSLAEYLSQSLPKAGLLARDRESRSGDVAQALDPPAWIERREARLLPPGTPLDLFVASERRLLILGECGCGTTTDLLQVAGGLVELARYAPEQPVPVVLRLGSWGPLSRRLAGWMAGEMLTGYKTLYKLDPALVRDWIEQDRLLPLLDGLEEVERGCRHACVCAINEFLAAHPKCGLAVSCRSDAYQDLDERLALRDAYALRPLRDAALDEFLAAGGAGAEPLRAALQEPGRRELARIPLRLVVLDRMLCRTGSTTQAAAPAALESSLADTPAAATAESLPPHAGDGLRPLMAAYFREMLRHPPQPLPARSGPSLVWLAARMKAHHLELFQLERLQPSWLPGASRVWIYAVASRALGGALLLLPVAVWRPDWTYLLLVGLAAGAVAGALDGWRLRAIEAAVPAVAASAAGTLKSLPHGPAARAWAIGGAAMIFFNLFAALSLCHARLLHLPGDLPNGLQFGLLYGALFGLVFGLRRGLRERGDTEIAAGLTRSRWSWGKCRQGALWTLLLLALWWLIERLRARLGQVVYVDSVLLFVSVVVSAIAGLACGLLGDVVEEDDSDASRRRSLPPGLRRAIAENTHAAWRVLQGVAVALGVLLLILTLALKLADVLFADSIAWLAASSAVLALGVWCALALRGRDLVRHPALRRALWTVLLLSTLVAVGFGGTLWHETAFWGLTVGWWCFLALRGLDFVQHYTLRLLLRVDDAFPFRWVRFLDQAVACDLMHRAGSGYEFFHIELRDALAAGAPAGRLPARAA